MYASSMITTGNVGIGTTAPSAQLQILNASMNRLTGLYIGPSTQSGIVLDSTSGTNGKSFNIWSTSSADSVAAGSLVFFDITSSVYRMVISPSGQVGIGTTGPGYLLDVNGTARITGAVIMPYIVWHFNWSAAQGVGVIGSSSIVNSINNTNISGTYINTPSSGRFTVPHTGVYMCIFDCATTGVSETKLLLRIDGTYYNPYATYIGNYTQATYTEIV
jgi:hypothetical protein